MLQRLQGLCLLLLLLLLLVLMKERSVGAASKCALQEQCLQLLLHLSHHVCLVSFLDLQNFSQKTKIEKKSLVKTVLATNSPMMRTFDKKNLGKRPPPFSYTPPKTLGRWVCVDRA